MFWNTIIDFAIYCGRALTADVQLVNLAIGGGFFSLPTLEKDGVPYYRNFKLLRDLLLLLLLLPVTAMVYLVWNIVRILYHDNRVVEQFPNNLVDLAYAGDQASTKLSGSSKLSEKSFAKIIQNKREYYNNRDVIYKAASSEDKAITTNVIRNNVLGFLDSTYSITALINEIRTAFFPKLNSYPHNDSSSIWLNLRRFMYASVLPKRLLWQLPSNRIKHIIVADGYDMKLELGALLDTDANHHKEIKDMVFLFMLYRCFREVQPDPEDNYLFAYYEGDSGIVAKFGSKDSVHANSSFAKQSNIIAADTTNNSLTETLKRVTNSFLNNLNSPIKRNKESPAKDSSSSVATSAKSSVPQEWFEADNVSLNTKLTDNKIWLDEDFIFNGKTATKAQLMHRNDFSATSKDQFAAWPEDRSFPLLQHVNYSADLLQDKPTPFYVRLITAVIRLPLAILLTLIQVFAIVIQSLLLVIASIPVLIYFFTLYPLENNKVRFVFLSVVTMFLVALYLTPPLLLPTTVAGSSIIYSVIAACGWSGGGVIFVANIVFLNLLSLSLQELLNSYDEFSNNSKFPYNISFIVANSVFIFLALLLSHPLLLPINTSLILQYMQPLASFTLVLLSTVSIRLATLPIFTRKLSELTSALLWQNVSLFGVNFFGQIVEPYSSQSLHNKGDDSEDFSDEDSNVITDKDSFSFNSNEGGLPSTVADGEIIDFSLS